MQEWDGVGGGGGGGSCIKSPPRDATRKHAEKKCVSPVKIFCGLHLVLRESTVAKWVKR